MYKRKKRLELSKIRTLIGLIFLVLGIYLTVTIIKIIRPETSMKQVVSQVNNEVGTELQ